MVRVPLLRKHLGWTLALLALLCCAAGLRAQTQDTGGRVVLVLPFANRSGQANLDWIGESFAETVSDRLQSTGYLTISRDNREYALDHLGLPAGFRPSRATTIRIAQTLDAEYVIVGSYRMQNNRVQAQAQIVRVDQLRMTQPLEDSAELARLLDLENAIAWKCAGSMDPRFSVAESTFLAASTRMRLDAYESYIRGLVAATDAERIQRLSAAVAVAPTFAPALLALGKTQYAARQYDAAAATLAKVPATDPLALEAGFFRGLARFNAARYAEAESAFAGVAAKLPLPEVVNNQGAAQARQKRDGTPLLQRASAADPQDSDYHFNVAVALRRRGDVAGAKTEIEQALKLRPGDAEAAQLRAVLNGSASAPAGYDPQERIRRTYSEAAFRQAAFQMDEMRAMRSATLPPAERAANDVLAGREYLTNGLVLEAEREFQSAITADPRSAAAHVGLAEVRERTGRPDDARHEAQAAIDIQPNAPAYIVLARLDLQANQLAAAASDVSNALKLEPNNSAARGLRIALQNRGQALP